MAAVLLLMGLTCLAAVLHGLRHTHPLLDVLCVTVTASAVVVPTFVLVSF